MCEYNEGIGCSRAASTVFPAWSDGANKSAPTAEGCCAKAAAALNPIARSTNGKRREQIISGFGACNVGKRLRYANDEIFGTRMESLTRFPPDILIFSVQRLHQNVRIDRQLRAQLSGIGLAMDLAGRGTGRTNRYHFFWIEVFAHGHRCELR